MQVLPKSLQHTFDGIAGPGSELSPTRIVLDSVNAGSTKVAFRSYAESGAYPHFTIDPSRKEVWQHFSMDVSAVGVTNPPIEPHRIGQTIWVNILKMGTLSESESFWVGSRVGSIASEIGCSDHWLEFPSEFSHEYRTSQLSLGLWREFNGICGAAHVPHTPSNGPGALDGEAFREGLVSSTVDSLQPLEGSDTIVIETDEVVATLEVIEPSLINPEDSQLGPFPGRKVKLGSGGKAVTMLREAYGLGSGKFDDELLTIVLETQESAGMTADGIVDSTTWDALAERMAD